MDGTDPDGMRITGVITKHGNEERYMDLTVDGYVDGTLFGVNRISGTMKGYESNVRCEITVHRSLGDTTTVEYRDMR